MSNESTTHTARTKPVIDLTSNSDKVRLEGNTANGKWMLVKNGTNLIELMPYQIEDLHTFLGANMPSPYIETDKGQLEYDFGQVNSGGSYSLAIRFWNNGAGAAAETLTVPAGNFTASTTAVTPGSGEYQDITVTYAPPSVGTESISITLSGANPLTLKLRGEAV